jgi:Protein of unknown function (DUF1749)
MSSSTADGRLHRYWPERNLTLFEYLPSGGPVRANHVIPNTLLVIGGPYDSFGSVRYVPTLASHIHRCEDWTVMEVQLSSSGLGWATGDLHRDVEELAKAVEYIRNRVKIGHAETANTSDGGIVVLMGHSTGSQDVLHYLYHQSGQERPPVDGSILQAAVSDREALAMMCGEDKDVQHAYEECLRIALDGETEHPRAKILTLPLDLTSQLGWVRAHVSCKRFLSLVSPSSPARPELDDLFSSDLSDETLRETFGTVGKRGLLRPAGNSSPSMLVLLSGDDEYTPKFVDKEKLMERWRLALEHGSAGMARDSGVIVGASHSVKEHQSQLDLTMRVLKYLNSVAGGVGEAIFVRLSDEYKGLESH